MSYEKPAFPIKVDDCEIAFGMNMGDYFAGQVLAGFCSHRKPPHKSKADLARQCYDIAEAMCAESYRRSYD